MPWSVCDKHLDVYRLQALRDTWCLVVLVGRCPSVVPDNPDDSVVLPAFSGYQMDSLMFQWHTPGCCGSHRSPHVHSCALGPHLSRQLLDTHCLRPSDMAVRCESDIYNPRCGHRRLYLWEYGEIGNLSALPPQ